MRRSLRFLIWIMLVVPLPSSLLLLRVSAEPSEHFDLLIIGPQKYGALMGHFTEFKAGQGIAARYVAIESIGLNCDGLELARRLHSFIAEEYERAGMPYLLLVGTYDQVPTRYVYCPSDELGLADFSYKPTDWYYGVLDWQDAKIGLLGGNVPSIAVGRLPVKNEGELEQVLSKIISVESSFEPGVFLAIGDPMAKAASTLGVPEVYYSFNTNLSTTSLMKALSDGASYVMSYSHGTASALWTRTREGEWEPLMTHADAYIIGATYRIHYLEACFTGAIDLSNESLARSLLVSPTGPALVIASSRTEGSGNAISSRFWSELFATGDVGLSLLNAVQSYLLDSSVFSAQEASFRQYNYYLNKVIYGDVSWTIREPKGTVKGGALPAAAEAPPPSVDEGAKTATVVSIQREGGDSDLVVAAAPLACAAFGGLTVFGTKKSPGKRRRESHSERRDLPENLNRC